MDKNINSSSQNIAAQRKWWPYFRDFGLLLILIIAVTLWQTRDMLDTDGSVVIAQQNLVNLDGEVLPMLATDKPNLVYFFAPWCKICALSIGNLAYLNPDKVNVVVIALDYSSEEAVYAFVREHEVSAPVFFGHEDLKAQFQIQGYPSYYLLDANNAITSRSFGYSTAVGLKLREVFGHN